MLDLRAYSRFFNINDIMKRLLPLLLLPLLLACSSDNSVGRGVLVVTAEPYRYVVEAVAGDGWRVESLVPKGDNPETFDPTPRDIVSLANSSAYFMVGGLGFEDAWMDRFAEMYPNLKMFDTSEGIIRADGDPHLWTSPDNMALIAKNVCSALCSIDGANADGYRARLRALDEKIAATNCYIAQRLVALKGDTFLVFHPSLTYFARLYGLHQLSIEEEGKEPSVAHIKSIIDEAKRRSVTLVLVQSEFDSKNAVTIAGEIGARVISIDPLNYDWHTELRKIADEMAENRISLL